jgi:hypothetical protein
MDGHPILDITFPLTKQFPLRETTETGEKSIYLSEGDHSVEAITVVLRTHGAPNIFLRRADSVEEPKSLWASLNY